MPKHKVLKAVAHNVADSFLGTLNYWNDDYVMGKLLTESYRTGEGEYFFDLLSGECSPSFAKMRMQGLADKYKKLLRENIISQGAAMEFVKSARFEISFDLTRARPRYEYPELKESPYVCKVRLIDEKGVDHGVPLTGWWSPEPTIAKKKNSCSYSLTGPVLKKRLARLMSDKIKLLGAGIAAYALIVALGLLVVYIHTALRLPARYIWPEVLLVYGPLYYFTRKYFRKRAARKHAEINQDDFNGLEGKIVQEIVFNPAEPDDVSIMLSEKCSIAIYGKSILNPGTRSWKDLDGCSLTEVSFSPEKSIALHFSNGMDCFISLLSETYEGPERVFVWLPDNQWFVL